MRTIADIHRMGLPIFPMVGKKPAVRGWQDISRHAEIDNLRDWWRRGYRAFGIYLLPTPLCVVDGDDESAVEWMRLTLPQTPWRTKTKRGEHWYFARPKRDIREGRVLDDPPVDLKWKSGVTAPFSQRDDFTYEPVGDWSVPAAALPELPVLECFLPLAEKFAAQKRAMDFKPCPLISDKAMAFIRRSEKSVQGSYGSFQCKRAAGYFVNGLGLAVDDAMEWMRVWNQECAIPEWSERELRHACETAHREGPRNGLPVGYAFINPRKDYK